MSSQPKRRPIADTEGRPKRQHPCQDHEIVVIARFAHDHEARYHAQNNEDGACCKCRGGDRKYSWASRGKISSHGCRVRHLVVRLTNAGMPQRMVSVAVEGALGRSCLLSRSRSSGSMTQRQHPLLSLSLHKAQTTSLRLEYDACDRSVRARSMLNGGRACTAQYGECRDWQAGSSSSPRPQTVRICPASELTVDVGSHRQDGSSWWHFGRWQNGSSKPGVSLVKAIWRCGERGTPCRQWEGQPYHSGPVSRHADRAFSPSMIFGRPRRALSLARISLRLAYQPLQLWLELHVAEKPERPGFAGCSAAGLLCIPTPAIEHHVLIDKDYVDPVRSHRLASSRLSQASGVC